MRGDRVPLPLFSSFPSDTVPSPTTNIKYMFSTFREVPYVSRGRCFPKILPLRPVFTPVACVPACTSFTSPLIARDPRPSDVARRKTHPPSRTPFNVLVFIYGKTLSVGRVFRCCSVRAFKLILHGMRRSLHNPRGSRNGSFFFPETALRRFF